MEEPKPASNGTAGRSKSPGPRTNGGRSKSPRPPQQQGNSKSKSKSPGPGGRKQGKSKSPTRQDENNQNQAAKSKSKSPVRQRQRKSKSPNRQQQQQQQQQQKQPPKMEEQAAVESPALSHDFMVDGIMLSMNQYVEHDQPKSSSAMEKVMGNNNAVAANKKENGYATTSSTKPTAATNGKGFMKQLPEAFQCDPFLAGIVVEADLKEMNGSSEKTQEKKNGDDKTNANGKGRSKSPKRRQKSKSPGRQKQQKVPAPPPVSAPELEDKDEDNTKAVATAPKQTRAKSPKARSKSPCQKQGKKSKSPGPRNRNATNISGKAGELIGRYPLHIQTDPYFVGICSGTSHNAIQPTPESLNALSLVAQQTAKSQSIMTPPPSPLQEILPLTYLEVEPLMSQMVPKELTEAINLEMSKSLDVDDAYPEDSFMSPVKQQKSLDLEEVDLTTPPTNLAGKVAFFEKLMRQKEEKPTVDPTVKVKAAVSDKVKSKHDEVRSSLVANKKGKAGMDLPQDITPVAQKRERVKTFFDKEEDGMQVPVKQPQAQNKSTSTWAKVATAKPVTFKPLSEDDSDAKNKEQTNGGAEAPAQRVDDLVTAVEKNVDANKKEVKAAPPKKNPEVVKSNGHAPKTTENTVVSNGTKKTEESAASEAPVVVSKETAAEIEQIKTPEETNKENVSTVSVASEAPAKEPSTKKQAGPSTAKEPELQPEPISKDDASTSKDVAPEVLEASEGTSENRVESPSTVASMPIEEFPSLGAKTSKHSSSAKGKSQESFGSYAMALSKGKKAPQPKPVSKPAPTPGDVTAGFGFPGVSSNIDELIASVLGRPSPSKTASKTKTTNKQERPKTDNIKKPASTVDSDNKEKARMEESAQRLAEASPQKKAAATRDDSTSSADYDPGFSKINKKPGTKVTTKRKKKTSDANGKAAETSRKIETSVAEPSVDADAALVQAASDNLKKKSFNPYSLLTNDVDKAAAASKASKEERVEKAPKKEPKKGKSKGKMPKVQGTHKKKRSVRFGATTKAADDNMSDADVFEQFQSPPLWTRPLHMINNLVHVKPLSYIFDGMFWVIVLLLGGPLAAVGVLVTAIYRMLMFFPKLLGFGYVKPKKNPDQKLAVVITGCDSGFGRDLAFSLLKEGFVVFCCCLRKESLKDFETEALATPIQVDVTKDKDVEKASKQVMDWLSKEDGRYLHALVNNAGIADGGVVDWLPISDYQKTMQVNYFGMVRCCKKFLPLFKFQASEGIYPDARIVNMVSVAGLVSGEPFLGNYQASKHAAEAFTTNLRREASAFGLKVTGLNPTFHKTPLTKDMHEIMEDRWKLLSPEMRKEYGEDYLRAACTASKVASEVICWDSRNVVKAMQETVTTKAPLARVLVGSDAKYIFKFVHMLPAWVTDFVATLKAPRDPAIMNKK